MTIRSEDVVVGLKRTGNITRGRPIVVTQH